jgi:hypothetical protein
MAYVVEYRHNKPLGGHSVGKCDVYPISDPVAGHLSGDDPAVTAGAGISSWALKRVPKDILFP